MIQSVTITNYLDESITMELCNPDATGLAIVGIDGIGPEKAELNINEFSGNDGAVISSARLPSRNIVMHIQYTGDSPVEDLRHKTYKFFPLRKKVGIIIVTDARTLEISGYVESNEQIIFSDKAGCDVSIICPMPFFYSHGVVTSVFYGTQPVFEFPFSNESLTKNMLEMSTIQNQHEKVINYEGDIDVGIVIHIHVIGPVHNIVVYDVNSRETMKLDSAKIQSFTGNDFMDGDDITISTVHGEKFVHLRRKGKTINILNCMDRNIHWFTLAHGDNIFAYTADSGEDNVLFAIEHRVAYEGV